MGKYLVYMIRVGSRNFDILSFLPGKGVVVTIDTSTKDESGKEVHFYCTKLSKQLNRFVLIKCPSLFEESEATGAIEDQHHRTLLYQADHPLQWFPIELNPIKLFFIDFVVI
jgi:hypothetical protein